MFTATPHCCHASQGKGVPLKRSGKLWASSTALILAFLAVPAALAQEAETGSLQGRVFNAQTGQYVANAVVTIDEPSRRAITDDFGVYSFYDLPPGEVDLTVSYIGRAPQTATVVIEAGETVTQDFRFSVRASEEGEVFELGELIVESHSYESAAEIAIAEERFSPNLKNVVSAEAFGHIPEGNIGEFVKFIPGVLIEYGAQTGGSAAGEDATGVSIRGFPPSMTAIMIDGVPIANAQPGQLTRAVGLDMLSINNASRVEVVKVPTPDMPSDSIGGYINLISKSAFEYAKPTFDWRAYLSLNSENLEFWEKSPGPSRDETYKALPGFDFTYVLPLNETFGLSITGSSSNQFNEHHGAEISWLYDADGEFRHVDGHYADPRSPFIEDIEISDRPRVSNRHSASIKLDYIPWDGHLVTVNYQLSIYDSVDTERSFQLNPSASSDWGPDYVIGTFDEGSAEMVTRAIDKVGTTHTGYVKWRYAKGPWEIEAHLSKSSSESSFVSGENGHFSEVELAMDGVEQVILEDIEDGIPQTIRVLDENGQPLDHTKLSSYSLGVGEEPLFVRAGQQDTESNVSVYKLDVGRDLDFLPFDGMDLAVQVGVYREENEVVTSGPGINYSYEYIGPVDAFDAERYMDHGYSGISPGFGYPGQEWSDPYEVYDFFQEHPEWFDPNSDDTTYNGTAEPGEHKSVAAYNYEQFVNNNEAITETDTAWYALLEGEFFNHRLTAIGGFRTEASEREGRGAYRDEDWEYLKNPDGTIYEGDPNTPNGRLNVTSQEHFDNADRDALEAANIEWDHVVVRNSLEAIQREFIPNYEVDAESKGKPYYMASIAYDITDNLVARLSYSRNHGKPDFEDILRRIEFQSDEDDGEGGIIRVGNPELEPWTADNYDLSLAYYTDSGGKLAVSYFVKNVKNFHLENERRLTQGNYEEQMTMVGLTPNDYYVGWDLNTTLSGQGTAKTTGYEFEASHPLDFLGGWGKHFYVFANYTTKKLSANQDITGQLGATSNDFATGGVSFQYKRFSTRVNVTYRDENIRGSDLVPLYDHDPAANDGQGGPVQVGEIAVYEFEPAETRVDVSVGYQFTDHIGFFANARNVTNTSQIDRRSSAGDVYPSYAEPYEIKEFSVQVTLGLEGRF